VILNLATKVRKLARVLLRRKWRHALFYHRVAAGVEHVSVLRNLSLLRTVVDIGANRGQFALAVRQIVPDAHIVSFEPLPGPAAIYRDIFGDDSSVVLHEMAVGAVAGEAIIHLSARDDSSSLLPITERQNALFPGTAEIGTAVIRVVRLEDLLGADDIVEPALLKIDVQGFELVALEGCGDLLDRFAWVYVECSFVELYSGQASADSVVAWLYQRTFSLSGVYNMTYDDSGCAVQADFLFIRR
jgi:FkbM family methyltransferase